MAKKRSLPDSTARENWKKIFNSLTRLLRTQQSQLETLVKERKLLEDHVKMQHERWVGDVRLLEDQISQAKQKLLLQEMVEIVNAAKSDFLITMKQREAGLNKHKLEYANDELTDFKALLECVAQKCSSEEGSERNSAETGKRKRGDRNGDMNSQVKRLKRECEKLSREKDNEVSALLNEKSFVWNQYNTLETKYTSELKSKRAEVELANGKISELLTRVDQLHSSNNEKDDIIARMKRDMAKKDNVTRKCNDEISRLSQELELSRKLRIASTTPLLRRCCTRGAKTTSSGGYGVCSTSNGAVKKESSAAQLSNHSKDSEKDIRSSKRKGVEAIIILETPKLFLSRFKVPKLKSSAHLRPSPIFQHEQKTQSSTHVSKSSSSIIGS